MSKTKRITLYVPEQIDLIRDKLAADSGVKTVSYTHLTLPTIYSV